jgi:hypothetical protein
VNALLSTISESLNMVCLQESAERSRLAVSQSGHGSRVMLEPDMEVTHSSESRLPPLQVLGGLRCWGLSRSVLTVLMNVSVEECHIDANQIRLGNVFLCLLLKDFKLFLLCASVLVLINSCSSSY